MNIISAPSKNFESRQGYKPEAVVIHCTDGFFPGDLEWLMGRGKVSSHYLIAPSGDVYSLVDDSLAAWHSGLVVNPTATLKEGVNPNLYTLGIEVSLKVPGTINPEQWKALKELVKTLCDKHYILIDRKHIWGHREIRSDKVCPSTAISVDQLVKELTVPPATTPTDKEVLKKKIISYIESL